MRLFPQFWLKHTEHIYNRKSVKNKGSGVVKRQVPPNARHYAGVLGE